MKQPIYQLINGNITQQLDCKSSNNNSKLHLC